MPSAVSVAVALLGLVATGSAQDPGPCNPFFPQGAASLKQTFPPNLVCNHTGVRRTPAPQTFTCSAQSLEDCAQSCYAQKGCISFEYSAGAGNGGTNLCNKYLKTLRGQDFKRGGAPSGIFYNKGCFNQQALPAPVQLINDPGVENPGNDAWHSYSGNNYVAYEGGSADHDEYAGTWTATFSASQDGNPSTGYLYQNLNNPFPNVPVRYQTNAAFATFIQEDTDTGVYSAVIAIEDNILYEEDICTTDNPCLDKRDYYNWLNITAQGQLQSLSSTPQIRFQVVVPPSATDDGGNADEMYFYVQPISPP